MTSTEENGGQAARQNGAVALVVVGGVAAVVGAVYAIALPLVTPAFRGKLGLPFVPATTRQIDMVLQHCRQRGGTFVDLGSGTWLLP